MYRARITNIQEIEADGSSLFDYPERTLIHVEPLDCTFDEFRAAFEDADKDNKFIFSQSGAIFNIGGFGRLLEKGRILCIAARTINVLPATALETSTGVEAL